MGDTHADAMPEDDGGQADAPATQDDDARSDIEQAVEARANALERGEGGGGAERSDDFAGTGGAEGVVKNQGMDGQ